jgi:hypothetical protein
MTAPKIDLSELEYARLATQICRPALAALARFLAGRWRGRKL